MKSTLVLNDLLIVSVVDLMSVTEDLNTKQFNAVLSSDGSDLCVVDTPYAIRQYNDGTYISAVLCSLYC